VLVYVFYFLLGIAPTPLGRIDIISLPPPHITGFYLIDAPLAGEWSTAWSALKQLILPAITLALFTLAPLARMTRAAMLQAMGSDYIRTARACGLSQRKILVSYALRNALLPVVTTLGMVFSFSLGANVLVEKVFSWPGIGSYAIEALVVSDYAAVQGFVLAMAILFVVLNLCVDMVYTVIDPRLKIDG
jgi:peptide/nickel transport system permease protein